MSMLQWRDVNAPDFSGAVAANAQFGQLLNNAFASARTGINDFDRAKSAAVNAGIMAELAKIQDVAHAKTAANDLLAGIDPRRVNSATLSALMARPTELLNQDTLEGNLDWSNKVRTRQAGQWGATDASRPVYGALALANGNESKINEILSSASNQQLINQLTPEEIIGLRKTGNDFALGAVQLEGSKIGNKQANLNLEKGTWNFGNEKTEYADTQAGMAAFQHILTSGVTDPDQAGAALEGLKLSPRAYNFALTQLESRFPGIYGSMAIPGVDAGSGAGGGAPAAGGDSTRIMNYQAAAAGFKTVPASVQTLGQASDYAKSINRAGVDSSAMGTYQIVGTTMRNYAPRLFGTNWQNTPFNFESQDKIAEAIFNDHKGSAGALRKQWVSLSPADAERARKLPWAQAREIIAKGESSSSPAAISSGNATAINAKTKVNQVMGGVPQNGEPSPVEVAGQLLTGPLAINVPMKDKDGKETGRQAGIPLGVVASRIKDIIAKSKVNGVPTVTTTEAGEILANSFRARGAVESFFGPLASGTTLAGNNTFDDAEIAAGVAAAKRGEFTSRRVQAADTAGTAAQVEALRQAATQAQAQAQALALRAIQRPSLAGAAMNAKALADAKTAAYNQANAVANVSQVTGQRAPLEPESQPQQKSWSQQFMEAMIGSKTR